jgi:mannose-6-phosphate isomerase
MPGKVADDRAILVEGPKFVLERWEGGHRKVKLPDGVTGWLVPLKGEGVADGVPFRAGDCLTLEGEAELHAEMGSDLLFAYPGTRRS